MAPPHWQRLALLAPVLVIAAATAAHAYIEVVHETGCHDAQLRLTCRNLESTIAILEVYFSPELGECAPDNETTSLAPTTQTSTRRVGAVAPDAEAAEDASPEELSPYIVRPALNRRCSGRNTCSFLLPEDCPDSNTWGPGRLHITYACADRANVTRSCGGDALLAGSGGGLLQTPAYPSYYVGELACQWRLHAPPGRALRLSLLDVSLRDRSKGDSECRDVVRVSEGERPLLEACGELPRVLRLRSTGRQLSVSVLTTSKTLFIRRGVLIHYAAVGCGEPPAAPADGYRASANETHAQYLCFVGHVFADTHHRDRLLRCDARTGSWAPTALPECVNSTDSWTALRLNSAEDNSTMEASPVPKESDLMIDVLLPTMIICVLLLGNGVIIFVILYLRKRKLPSSGDEELGAICQPQDSASVSDRAICV